MENELLAKVKRFYFRHKRLPSFKEMQRLFGFTSNISVSWEVHKWITEGLLKIEDKQLIPTQEFFRLPLLGIVKAGSPTSESPFHDSVSLDEYLVPNPGYTYLLRVSGDSMVDKGIEEGDLVVLDGKREPRNGDVVAACVDGEWTVKIFRKENSSVYLQPANAKYQPIFPNQSLSIGGVVVSVIRKYY